MKIHYEEQIQNLGQLLQDYNAKRILEKSLLTLKELKIARDYISKLEKIQETVFKVDGPVAKSLRSWAFNTISHNASHYLEMLNTKINKIQMFEELFGAAGENFGVPMRKKHIFY